MPVGGPIKPSFNGTEDNIVSSTALIYPDLIGPAGGSAGGSAGGPQGASAGGPAGGPWSGQSTFDFNLFSATSQVPGDQDLIQNPYLQSAAYSASTYSAKNEPVPYLADFSAFMR